MREGKKIRAGPKHEYSKAFARAMGAGVQVLGKNDLVGGRKEIETIEIFNNESVSSA